MQTKILKNNYPTGIVVAGRPKGDPKGTAAALAKQIAARKSVGGLLLARIAAEAAEAAAA